MVSQKPGARRVVDLLVTGGHVLTMEPDAPEFSPGAVAADAGRIVAVGPEAAVTAAFAGRETLDARGCAVLPGLVDAYAHAGHGMIRGLMHPAAGWPAHLYWTHTTPEWWRAEADLSALERLRAGVTTGLSVIGATPARADRTDFADANAEAYLDAGLGLVIGIGPPDPVFPHLSQPFTATHPRDGALVRHAFTAEDTLRASVAVIDRWHGAADGRIRAALAPPYLLGRHVMHRRQPHRLPDASDAPAMLAHARLMREIADDRGVPIQTHMFRGSVDFALAHFGRAETARILGDGSVLAAHCNGLSAEEAQVLGAHRCGVAAVAFTHENLWYGVAPLPALIRAGCAVAATTDGAAPYTSLDLWREPARTAWNQWTAAGSQSVMPPETLLRMVTIDAARALGMADRVGSLTPGKDADLVVVDLAAAHFGPVADLAQSLVFYAAAGDVRDVVAKGVALMRDRRPTRADPGAIVAQAREQAAAALAGVDLRPYARGDDAWKGGPDWPAGG